MLLRKTHIKIGSFHSYCTNTIAKTLDWFKIMKYHFGIRPISRNRVVVIRNRFSSIHSIATPENTSNAMSSNNAMHFCTSENEATSLSDENGEVILEEDFGTIHVEQQDVVSSIKDLKLPSV
jgi:hypothetical protein